MTQSQKQDQKQMKALIELNTELENYFRNTLIPQLFVDANLILRKFTPPAMKQFDFRPEHIGRPVEEMVDNIRYSTIIDDIKGVIETEEVLEKEIQTTDLRWFEMNIIPYIVQKENIANGVIITFVDITGRIKVLKELENLNASHETFIYAVSHDLKGPLTNIDGLVKLLVKESDSMMEIHEKDNDQKKRIVEMLQSSVSTMRNVIDELGDIAKIKSNYKEASETINVEDLLKEVDLTVKDQINQSKAQIQTNINVKQINFSKKNLRSILYNLLSNAIKYKSPERDPEISITIEKENGFVVIAVKDNGRGIAADKVDKVFDQYARIEKDVEGTGIGLYLVKRIIENSDGKIEVESKPDKGSEFKVYLKAKANK